MTLYRCSRLFKYISTAGKKHAFGEVDQGEVLMEYSVCGSMGRFIHSVFPPGLPYVEAAKRRFAELCRGEQIHI